MTRLMVGSKRKFAYPAEFVTLPDYTAHSGQTVTVLRALTLDEAEGPPECEQMYEVEAADGWHGHAFESEIQEVA